ncbi:MAG: hypothetical protein ABW217_04780, partial [Polyangiaceae bacterium]
SPPGSATSVSCGPSEAVASGVSPCIGAAVSSVEPPEPGIAPGALGAVWLGVAEGTVGLIGSSLEQLLSASATTAPAPHPIRSSRSSEE